MIWPSGRTVKVYCCISTDCANLQCALPRPHKSTRGGDGSRMTPALGRWRQQQLPCIRPAPGQAPPQPRALLRDDIYLPAGNAREMILLESITSKGRRKCCITFRWELGQVVFPSIHIRPFTQHCTDFPEPLSRVWLCAGSGDGDKE